MAKSLIRAGYPLVVYNRTLKKAEPFKELGAEISKTPKDKKVGVIETGVELSDIDKLFDLDTIINDLKAGRVIINLTPEGEFVPPKL